MQGKRIIQPGENFVSELTHLNNNNSKRASLYVIACYICCSLSTGDSCESFSFLPPTFPLNYSNLCKAPEILPSHYMPATYIGLHYLSWALAMTSWLFCYLGFTSSYKWKGFMEVLVLEQVWTVTQFLNKSFLPMACVWGDTAGQSTCWAREVEQWDTSCKT